MRQGLNYSDESLLRCSTECARVRKRKSAAHKRHTTEVLLAPVVAQQTCPVDLHAVTLKFEFNVAVGGHFCSTATNTTLQSSVAVSSSEAARIFIIGKMRRTTLGPVTGGFEALDRSLDESRASFGAAPRQRKSLGPSGKTGNAPSTSKKAPTQSRMSLIPGPSIGPDTARYAHMRLRTVGGMSSTFLRHLLATSFIHLSCLQALQFIWATDRRRARRAVSGPATTGDKAMDDRKHRAPREVPC